MVERKAADGSLTPESEDDGDVQPSRILLLRPLCGPLCRPPRTSAGAKLSGLELHEDDVFWIGFGRSSFDPPSQRTLYRRKRPPTASARTTPATSKTQSKYSLSVPVGEIDQQSAPVNVPAVPPEVKKGWEEDGDDYEMLPPHEIVARGSGNGSPMIPFSVLKGAGRTLKGRDVRRVRNVVLQKTGFLD
ncbi:unnamed protein product [Musa banksii]